MVDKNPEQYDFFWLSSQILLTNSLRSQNVINAASTIELLQLQ